MASFESHATTPTLGCLWEARWYSPSECHGDPRAPTVWDFVCQVNHCLLAPTLGCVWEARWYSPSECHGDPRAPTVWDFVCQGERTKPTLGLPPGSPLVFHFGMPWRPSGSHCLEITLLRRVKCILLSLLFKTILATHWPTVWRLDFWVKLIFFLFRLEIEFLGQVNFLSVLPNTFLATHWPDKSCAS